MLARRMSMPSAREHSRIIAAVRVVFVAIGAEQLGIGVLSAILRRAGHDTRLVFNPALFEDRYNLDVPVLKDVFRRDARIVDEVLAHEPDVLLCLGGTALGTLPILVAGTANQKERLRTVLRRGEMAGFGLSEWNRGLDILGNEPGGGHLEGRLILVVANQRGFGRGDRPLGHKVAQFW